MAPEHNGTVRAGSPNSLLCIFGNFFREALERSLFFRAPALSDLRGVSDSEGEKYISDKVVDRAILDFAGGCFGAELKSYV
jgi:hypothetical protein